MLEYRRGAEGVNTHVCRASRASRPIAVAPEDDFVSQQLLHGRIGDAEALWDAQITECRGGLGQVTGADAFVEAGILDTVVLEEGCYREELVVRAVNAGRNCHQGGYLRPRRTWFSVQPTLVP